MEAMLRQMLADNKEFFSRLEAQKQPQATQSSNLAAEPKVVTQSQALPSQAVPTLQVQQDPRIARERLRKRLQRKRKRLSARARNFSFLRTSC